MLQIFTYSTGLALTGRSAACAPATATRPAAEPRRRLFTIFIVTSKFVVGRVPSAGHRSALEGPLSPRETTRFLSLAFRSDPSNRTGRLGDAPLHRVSNLSHGSCTEKKKRDESQAPERVFRRVLHKWHVTFCLPNGTHGSRQDIVEYIYLDLAFNVLRAAADKL